MKTILKNSEEKMEKTVSVLQADYAAIRAGRANPKVLDKILVDYYGVPTAINQMAVVSVPEARLLQIQPYDVTSLKEIEKAIQNSDLGINPQNDGRVIRLTFPQLTEERRKELSKDIARMGEDSKVAIRSIRRDAMDQLKNMKKNSEITEDDQKFAEEKIQKLTDRFCKTIDSVAADKAKEILSI